MAEAIAQACSYVEGMRKDEFLADTRTQDAVILKLLVVGEAAAQLVAECTEFVDQHPEIPWKQMRAMRNRMAHGYFDINLDVVWDTVQSSLPELGRQIAVIRRAPASPA
jgi:uncharacterized protein with HEPN domain